MEAASVGSGLQNRYIGMELTVTSLPTRPSGCKTVSRGVGNTKAALDSWRGQVALPLLFGDHL